MQRIGMVLGALLLAAVPAFAQRIDGRGVPYRVWDADAGVGFHSTSSADGDVGNEGYDYDNWNPSWATSVDVGYFWSSHLKTEAGVTWLQRYTTATSDQIVLPGGQYGYTFIRNDIRQTQVMLAATWQFFENAFAHPYVSGGVRLGMLDIDAHRESWVPIAWNGGYRTYQGPTVDEHLRKVRARPFVAVGSKSYFNERSFVRPEMVLGFNDRGVSQFGARLVFGLDF